MNGIGNYSNMDTYERDFSADASTQGHLDYGYINYGTVYPAGDVDWFSVNLTAGQTYHFSIEAGSINGLFDPQMALLDPQGHLIIQATVGQGFQTKFFDYTANVTATFYVAASGDPGIFGQYSLMVETSSTNITGSTGNDRFLNSSANQVVDGGGGVDTFVNSGRAASYALSISSDTITVRDKTGSGGTDSLRNIQNIEFADRTLDANWFLKTSHLSQGQIVDLVELYIASFNRAPDALGLAYWGSQLSDGLGLQKIANTFFNVPETASIYPSNMTTGQFVTKIYNNVLGRTPDQAGLDYWSGQIASGQVTKDQFMLTIIYGVRNSPGASIDAQHLSNKEQVGAHFALTDGLTNSSWASTVMSNVNGAQSSVTSAFSLADQYLQIANTPATSDLVVQLVGVGP